MKTLIAAVCLGALPPGTPDTVPRDQGKWGQLARALTWVESEWRPEAVSPDGARGVWQVMPIGAREARNRGCASPPSPLWGEAAVGALGSCLLRSYLEQYDNWVLAAVAYNAGQSRAECLQRNPRCRLPEETVRYIAKISYILGHCTPWRGGSDGEPSPSLGSDGATQSVLPRDQAK